MMAPGLAHMDVTNIAGGRAIQNFFFATGSGVPAGGNFCNLGAMEGLEIPHDDTGFLRQCRDWHGALQRSYRMWRVRLDGDVQYGNGLSFDTDR